MKLKEVQDRSYELLCRIDDICRKEGISWFLFGGAEIGAVREKDLIPWDDDIDICVRLEDYPAFRDAMRKHLPEGIRLLEPSDFAPHFYDFVVRIADTRYLLRKEKEEDRFYGNRQNYLGIDVFLIFRIPEKPLRARMAESRISVLYGLGMGHRYRIEFEKHSATEQLVIRMLSALGKLISARWVCRRFFTVANRMNRRPSGRAMSTWLAWSGPLKSEWYRETVYGELRGRPFPLHAGYEEELTERYGDYMHPPKDRNVYQQHLDEEDRYQEPESAG